MNKKTIIRIASGALCTAFLLTALPSLAGCTQKLGKKNAIVIMSDAVSGLYNPFYATAAPDMNVVGLTQIGMLSTDANGITQAGDHLPTVVKAFNDGEDIGGNQTQYTFVIKNGIKFSDGKPLTMNDVMFNLYEYLDPVYTGSSTMYSINIDGLADYRTQQHLSGDGTDEQDSMNAMAASYAQDRVNTLIDIFEENGNKSNSVPPSYNLTIAEMEEAIRHYDVDQSYKDAVKPTNEQDGFDFNAQLLEDYRYVLKTFKEELQSDWLASQENFDFNSAPYSDWKQYQNNEMFKFLVYEGEIEPEYRKNLGVTDRTKIERFIGIEKLSSSLYANKDTAINTIYDKNVSTAFNNIISYWATASTVATQFTADAISVLLKNNMKTDGTKEVENIRGIVSLGHTAGAPSAVTIDGVTYNVAKQHNADGTPTNPDEYDVLQITINGVDPKAIYSFGFTVAPAHYYTADAQNPNGRTIDIANNKFGVEFGDTTFQTKTIQSLDHQEIPIGAGPYKATDKNNSDNPAGSGFVSSNIIYYKANRNFMFPVKTEKLRMQVVSSANAMDALKTGAVDYIEPQFTAENARELNSLKKSGYETLSGWQLGYGYIGINAGKVPNINIRKAIMAAMNRELSTQYYEAGTCRIIEWPMSMMSWAYPFEDEGNMTSKENNKSFVKDAIDFSDANIQNVKDEILGYMNAAGVSAGDSQLKIKFTIAGASITDHPTYNTFATAAELLNSLGWDVEVKADSQALTKLATGSLQVWAAAWGSTIDPDMYQVYHKNSKATSVYAWGYREILADTVTYAEEYSIINELSAIIDDARSTMDQTTRTAYYEQAMGLVLDLAVELPVYQRQTLYAYNAKTVKGFTVVAAEGQDGMINPYSSPLEKCWELELV